MLSGPRLDPFSARLLAIHQKGKRAPSTGAVDDVLAVMAEVGAEVGAEMGAEVHQTAQSPPGSKIAHLEVDGFDREDDPGVAAALRAHVEAQGVVDTGCAACGGKDKRESDPVADLRREMAEVKARLAALEENLESLEREVAPGVLAM